MCPFCWYLLCAVRQIVEEAGGAVTRMDGEAFSVFDRSVIVSNGHLHSQVRCHSQEGVQEGGGGVGCEGQPRALDPFACQLLLQWQCGDVSVNVTATVMCVSFWRRLPPPR